MATAIQFAPWTPPAVQTMVFTKSLVVPPKQEHLTPSAPYPVRVGICIERKARPSAIGKAIANIIT